MKLGVTTIGTALAGIALLAAVAWPAQDAAGSKPGAAKAKPAQTKPAQATKAQTQPANKPKAAPGTKPQAAQTAKPPAKPAAKPADKPADAAAADDKAAGTADIDSIMATRFTKAATPTANHTWLATFVGKWKMVSSYTIMPDKPAVESTGTSEFKMLMDGRFLVESREANGGAGPFKGMGVIGFNSVTGKAERVWFDSTSTAMVKSEGELNAERNEIRWTDTWTDPLQNGVHTTTSVLKKVSDTEFTFQQLNDFHGTTFKSLLVQYRKD